METVLARLEVWLRANRASYLDQLLPPVTSDLLTRAAKRAEVSDLGSLADFYAWRGGQPSTRSASFWRNFEFLTVRRLTEDLEACMDLRESGDFPASTWRGWIPFLGSGNGDVCVDFLGAFGGIHGQIVETWSTDIREPTILAPSLEAWLDVFVTGLELELWADTREGVQPRDEASVDNLHEKMLPGFPRRVSL